MFSTIFGSRTTEPSPSPATDARYDEPPSLSASTAPRTVARRGHAARYITADEAKQIDAELMGPHGAFSLDQLMELAGLSIAQCVSELYPLGPPLPLDANGIKQKRTNERVLLCCGPGNQGGDGLVAARHLTQFGYAASIFYPKESKGEIFKRLKKQCENLELPLIAPAPLASSSFPMAPDAQANAFKRALTQADVVVDCVFGFSFHGPPRAPFDFVLKAFKATDRPILSVDIPSGWDVEKGNVDGEGFTADALISLTAPKLGVKEYAEEGRTHWLGGRFVPFAMVKERGLNLPSFPGSMQCVDITMSAPEQ
ncbi:YjeF [Microbotryum lychnidis-dioicae p1A1 Lamole]|uniref:NAD(P)H-hydrate epimerase n=1 Tax=Microbotryum lychnidis-dioicae (strain p1A1 Lamole / MvSl-1064) TaxID=683840 RepID=U5HGT4_USTV1|nr:YjeF [Microbotryum lychnidis-dioicae p1A1 Lamole]|eukprot:KDE03230.1 YjeF [Microbotryum lychnidis-dioicae p1A1 Lamole]